jgi:hypothetical protein
MPNLRRAGVRAAMGGLCLVMLLMGCAGRQTSQDIVSPLYMLKTAGFQPWEVNIDTTPKRLALMNSIPPGKMVAYSQNGAAYYVYADMDTNTLYVGDAAALQRYLSMTQGKQLCERVEGKNSQEFWGCFVEMQAGGGKPGLK